MAFTDMATTEMQIERFSLVSLKTFSDVLEVIDSGLGHPDLRQFHQNLAAANSWEELERVIAAAVGSCGLMEYARFDFGMILQKAQNSPAPRILRIVLGHPQLETEARPAERGVPAERSARAVGVEVRKPD